MWFPLRESLVAGVMGWRNGASGGFAFGGTAEPPFSVSGSEVALGLELLAGLSKVFGKVFRKVFRKVFLAGCRVCSCSKLADSLGSTVAV